MSKKVKMGSVEGVVLDPAQAMEAVQEMYKIIMKTAEYAQMIVQDLEDGKLEDAKGNADAIAFGMPGALIEVVKRHRLSADKVPAGMQEEMARKLEEAVKTGGVGGIVNFSMGKVVPPVKETVH